MKKIKEKVKKFNEKIKNFNKIIKKNRLELFTDLLVFSSFSLIYYTTYKVFNIYVANYLLSLFLLIIVYVINIKK